MESKYGFNSETEAIIRNYTILYKLIFKLSIFVILFGASLALNISIFLRYDTTAALSNNISMSTSSGNAFLARNPELQKVLSEENFDLMIHNGYLGTIDKTIQSSDNLLFYKNFALPNTVSFNYKLPLNSLASFTNPNYDPAQLSLFLDNIVLIDNSSIPKQEKFKLLPLDTSLDIKIFFGLSCIKNPLNKFNIVCQQKIREFNQKFFVYDLSKSRSDVRTIFDSIKTDPEAKKSFCNSLKAYVNYSNDTDQIIEGMMGECDMRNFFNTIKGFIGLQTEIKNNFFDVSTYFDKKLNETKLLSMMQRLYKNLKQRKIDEKELSIYIEFTRKILKESNRLIDQFYIDLLFTFNNAYLLPLITTNQSAGGVNNTKILSDFNQQIRQLNIGDKILGFSGLNELILQTGLINYFTVNTSISSGVIETLSGTTNYFQELSYLRLTKQEIQGEKGNFEGIIQMPITSTIKQAKVNFSADLKVSPATITAIEVENYNQLNELLNTFVQNGKRTIPEIYNTFLTQIDLYKPGNSTLGDICNQLKKNESYLQISLSACSPSILSFTDKKTSFSLTMSQRTINKISTPKTEIQEALSQSIIGISLQEIDPVEFLRTLTNFEPTPQITNDQAATIQNEASFVYDLLGRYFQITPEEVGKIGNNFLVKFTINNISFIGVFESKTNSISSLFFSQKNDQGQPIKINGVVLKFSTENTIDLNNFALDPFNYIKEKDPISALEYEKIIGPSQ
ncbi:MAG TPA: hypothetical protein PKC14_00590 [Candidatus Absconditabacterales bacterium]|nr:hypothetical protein [Candidatus Absconditabacterales bacterium]